MTSRDLFYPFAEIVNLCRDIKQEEIPTKAQRDPSFYRIARRFLTAGFPAAIAEATRIDKHRDNIKEAKKVVCSLYTYGFDEIEHRPSQCCRCKFKSVCSPVTIFSFGILGASFMRCVVFVPETKPDYDTHIIVHLTKGVELAELVYSGGFFGINYQTRNFQHSELRNQEIHNGTINEMFDLIKRDETVKVFDIRLSPIEYSGLLLYRVRPKRGESYEQYKQRVNHILAITKQRLEDLQKQQNEGANIDPLNMVKEIFIRLGHGDTLSESFGGDVLQMANAFFPGKTIEMILLQFKTVIEEPKKDITPKDVYREIINATL